MTQKPKVILITGTSSGIGLSIANYLSEQGHTVFGLSRTQKEGVLFTSIPTDITLKNEVENALVQILDKVSHIDIIINNAGRGMVGAVEDAEDEEVWNLFRLNLMGSVHLVQAVMPQFRKQNSGIIINISSIGSVMGLPFRGYYSASKAALDKTTEALRYELRDFGVQACVLHLGDIQTPIAAHRIESQVSPPYKSLFQKVYASMNAHVDKGLKPEVVSQKVEQLMYKKKLKAHYVLGKPMQRLSILLKKALPQNWFESMIRHYSDL